MLWVYSALLAAVLVVGAPYWLVRMMTSGRYRAGLAGRLGRVPAGLREAVAGKRVVWVHAVSVGEVMAATALVRELRAALPGWVVAVSTTTATGQRLAKERFAGVPVFYLPLDFKFAVRRYLAVLRPRMIVLMESELWPRLMMECERDGVALAVVNARVSDRSLPRYLRLKRLWRPLLERVSVFLAQSEENAARLRRIGAPADRVHVSGNLKYDIRVGAESELTRMLRDRLAADARVVVCGSTLEGEERMLLEAWPRVVAAEPSAVMVLAPRHPERFAAVASMVEASGFGCVRASAFRVAPVGIAPGSVFLLDTIGDLASVYSLGAVAFVGGSLVAKGGHNPLEAARFGVPVVMGGSYENFREIVDAMRVRDAIRVVDNKVIGDALVAMLDRSGEALAMGERGREVFDAQAGATARTTGALMNLLSTNGAGGR
ncbi:3-deoxy-D-manno-octulosonic acid transferase [Edaphobacter acidisoli]|uniref:3-deoxy-D-manno-octulosonic acid transferase n=1 Tax=Edaphobacter acidisoli TaxID=2040573 RepID=A0A916RYG3_9BACT|nr:3-deoxy-D-manno-octulosonic acid transferase [Edaphobacter acidisoli]GGA75561.1 3-deoxy-D-manno-octulosonic acid transferase [Edaphobacter acidisoli]